MPGFRKTGDKEMMQQGSWAVLGMEIERVLLRLLLSVPSLIAFDQQHKPFPFFRRNRPRTANVNQYAQFMTITTNV